MNIAILGWYHHRNAGDDRIQIALSEMFDGHTLAFLPLGRTLPNAFVRTYDALVIGGGGIFKKGGGIFKQMLKWSNTGIPIYVIGASLETNDKETLTIAKQAFSKCKGVWLRDSGSVELMKGLSNVQQMPDLSFLTPFEQKNTPGNTNKIGLVLRNESVLDKTKWQQYISKSPINLEPWFFYFEGQSDAHLFRELALADDCKQDYFKPELIYNYDVLLTARFHGILFAIQSGIPFVALSSKSKVARFLKDVGLSDLLLSENDTEDIKDKLDYLSANKDAIKSRLLALRKELTVSASKLTQQIVSQIKTDVALRNSKKGLFDKILLKLGL